jgi:RecA/RadA recombinase
MAIVWDSMGNTQTAAETKAPVGEKPMDDRPSMMRHFLTKLVAIVAGTSIVPVLINQTYVKYGGTIRFGEKTPKGGTAQKQFPTVCLRTSKSKKPIMDHNKAILGYRHNVVIEKSELGPGMNVGFAVTHHSSVGFGINDAYILFHELRDAAIIEQKASWSTLGTHKWQKTWIGFLETLQANPGMKTELLDTYSKIKGGQDATVYLPKS